MGDLAFAVGTNIFERHLGTLSWNDPGADLFAVLLVGNSENLYVLDSGMTEQELLYFTWIDILTATDQHIFDPTDNIAVTL